MHIYTKWVELRNANRTRLVDTTGFRGDYGATIDQLNVKSRLVRCLLVT